VTQCSLESVKIHPAVQKNIFVYRVDKEHQLYLMGLRKTDASSFLGGILNGTGQLGIKGVAKIIDLQPDQIGFFLDQTAGE